MNDHSYALAQEAHDVDQLRGRAELAEYELEGVQDILEAVKVWRNYETFAGSYATPAWHQLIGQVRDAVDYWQQERQ